MSARSGAAQLLEPGIEPYSPGASLPRLLVGVPTQGAMTLEEHVASHGELPGAYRGRHLGVPALVEATERAGLRGRGGGGFPTAAKMRATAAGRGRPIVVVNACEGEPASLKDRMLLETAPHLVLDGGALASQAVGADEVIVCISEDAPSAQESVLNAISERRRGADRSASWRFASVPAGYVAGQESALVSFLSGGPAKPTFTPPLPFERGVWGRPTLVNNPETLAHLALIARHGPDWFRGLGPSSQPGSALVTLGGCVAHPGVYEVEHGSPLPSLIEAAGGITEGARAVLIGGYAGAWIDARYLSSLALSDEALAPYGARLGTGVVVVLPERACGPAETARVARWLAGESAGQCGPCVHGLDALAGSLERALAGIAEPDQRGRLGRLLATVRGRGACSHPDGTARFLASAIEVFAEELLDHMQYGPCPACTQPGVLPVPATQLPRSVPAPAVAPARRPQMSAAGPRRPRRAGQPG